MLETPVQSSPDIDLMRDDNNTGSFLAVNILDVVMSMLHAASPAGLVDLYPDAFLVDVYRFSFLENSSCKLPGKFFKEATAVWKQAISQCPLLPSVYCKYLNDTLQTLSRTSAGEDRRKSIQAVSSKVAMLCFSGKDVFVLKTLYEMFRLYTPFIIRVCMPAYVDEATLVEGALAYFMPLISTGERVEDIFSEARYVFLHFTAQLFLTLGPAILLDGYRIETSQTIPHTPDFQISAAPLLISLITDLLIAEAFLESSTCSSQDTNALVRVIDDVWAGFFDQSSRPLESSSEPDTAGNNAGLEGYALRKSVVASTVHALSVLACAQSTGSATTLMALQRIIDVAVEASVWFCLDIDCALGNFMKQQFVSDSGIGAVGWSRVSQAQIQVLQIFMHNLRGGTVQDLINFHALRQETFAVLTNTPGDFLFRAGGYPGSLPLLVSSFSVRVDKAIILHGTSVLGTPSYLAALARASCLDRLVPSCSPAEWTVYQAVLHQFQQWRSTNPATFCFDVDDFEEETTGDGGDVSDSEVAKLSINAEVAKFFCVCIDQAAVYISSEDWDFMLCSAITWLTLSPDTAPAMVLCRLAVRFLDKVHKLMEKLATTPEVQALLPECLVIANRDWRDFFLPAASDIISKKFLVRIQSVLLPVHDVTRSLSVSHAEYLLLETLGQGATWITDEHLMTRVDIIVLCDLLYVPYPGLQIVAGILLSRFIRLRGQPFLDGLEASFPPGTFDGTDDASNPTHPLLLLLKLNTPPMLFRTSGSEIGVRGYEYPGCTESQLAPFLAWLVFLQCFQISTVKRRVLLVDQLRSCRVTMTTMTTMSFLPLLLWMYHICSCTLFSIYNCIILYMYSHIYVYVYNNIINCLQ